MATASVEIPTQPDEAGLLNMSQSRRMDFIVWMDYTSPDPEKSFGLLDEETNCYIELPMEWEGNLMLTDSDRGMRVPWSCAPWTRTSWC